jgi:hypothetical protein
MRVWDVRNDRRRRALIADRNAPETSLARTQTVLFTNEELVKGSLQNLLHIHRAMASASDNSC